MANVATDTTEQLTLLKNRGMIIKDESKAKEYLLDIGYFRLGFYWFPFEKSYPRLKKRDHNFKDGTDLDQIIELYYFDVDLRNLFLRYISRIEINFRTALIYHASNKYKDDPFWYINPKYVKQSFIDDEIYVKALKDAQKESVIKNDLIQHKRKNAPAWKLIENLTFGIVVSLFDNLTDGGLKHLISSKYKIESSNQFSSYINTIRRLRNHCAHGKVLFDMKLPEAVSNGPAGNLTGDNKTSLWGAYCAFRYILGCISTNRLNDMKNDLSNIFTNLKFEPIKKIIYDNTGFRGFRNNNI